MNCRFRFGPLASVKTKRQPLQQSRLSRERPGLRALCAAFSALLWPAVLGHLRTVSIALVKHRRFHRNLPSNRAINPV
jgi:hypothetical protein